MWLIYMDEKQSIKTIDKNFIKEMKKRGYSAKYARKIIKEIKRKVPEFKVNPHLPVLPHPPKPQSPQQWTLL